jgi:hypothetical protein
MKHFNISWLGHGFELIGQEMVGRDWFGMVWFVFGLVWPS